MKHRHHSPSILTTTKAMNEYQRKHLKHHSQISLWLDTYDDIFSDFDPRHYSERALSDDFLIEAKKASLDKEGGQIELQFLVPHQTRNMKHESIIKQRLRAHFQRHVGMLHNEHRNLCIQGGLFVATGLLLMFVSTYLVVMHQEKNVFLSFIVVLFEPGGWFLFWEGLELLIFETKRQRPALEFYEKMAKCYIKFLPY